MNAEIKRINCHKCKYFYVTWDNKFPYGCRMMGFKSKLIPSLEVFQASGERCHAFEEKILNEQK